MLMKIFIKMVGPTLPSLDHVSLSFLFPDLDICSSSGCSRHLMVINGGVGPWTEKRCIYGQKFCDRAIEVM